jgi:hypothetical protein
MGGCSSRRVFHVQECTTPPLPPPPRTRTCPLAPTRPSTRPSLLHYSPLPDILAIQTCLNLHLEEPPHIASSLGRLLVIHASTYLDKMHYVPKPNNFRILFGAAVWIAMKLQLDEPLSLYRLATMLCVSLDDLLHAECYILTKLNWRTHLQEAAPPEEETIPFLQASRT